MNIERIIKVKRANTKNIAVIGIQIFVLFQEAKDTNIAIRIRPIEDGKKLYKFIFVFPF